MDSPRELAAKLRQKHQQRDCPEGAFCEGNCYQPCVCGDRWPCPKKAETEAIAAELERGADAIEARQRMKDAVVALNAVSVGFHSSNENSVRVPADAYRALMDATFVAASAVEGSNQ